MNCFRLMTTSVAASAALAAAIAATGSTATANSSSPAHGLDRVWIQSSIEGDRFEVIGARIALHRSHNAAVRTLARRLLDDHTRSLADTKALARAEQVPVPTTPSPSQSWELQELSELPAGSFDRRYAALEVRDHEQDLQEANDERTEGSRRLVRESAADEIPTLTRHLRMARAALRHTHR